LGPTRKIEAAVQAWRRQAGAVADSGAGEDLARLVWQPLRPHLAGAHTLLAAPDGPLHALPLAALPARRPGTFALDAFAVSHVTSGRHLLEITGDRPPAAAGLLAVGGLDYGSAAGQDKGARTSWPPLPGTRLEVEAVAALFRDAFP